MRVLVVDNHPLIRQFMSQVLEQEGCEVVTADSGLQALERLETFTPDLMFVDLVMPYIDGRELLRIVRGRPDLSRTYVVVLSAVAAEEGEEASVAEADACIAKGPLPAMRQYVLAVLASLRSGARLRGLLGLEGVYRRNISEELLREARHRRAIIAALREAVVEMAGDYRIVAVNPAAEQLFGATSEQLLAQPFGELFASGLRDQVMAMLASPPGEALAVTEREPLVVRGRRVTLDVIRVHDESEPTVVAILQDVTRRRETEERLLASLREKEILLREAYHRVKNNMQVIASLLSLQATLTGDPRFSELLRASESRIQAMTLVHEALYRAESLASIELASYLEGLVDMLLGVYGRERAVVETKVEPVQVATRLAVPCGLILNELIGNAVRFAAGPDGAAHIRVQARTVGSGLIELSVSDDGPGLPASAVRTQGLGLRLVSGLVESQLDGTHEIKSGPGLKHIIRFRLEE